MEAARTICIGFDVGKSTHRACAVSRETGETLFSKALENREGPIDEALELPGRDALVVFDQKRNIGALACSSTQGPQAWRLPIFPACL